VTSRYIKIPTGWVQSVDVKMYDYMYYYQNYYHICSWCSLERIGRWSRVSVSAWQPCWKVF
jgi:hypothetical protein